ncbi:hypothetical protein SDC9_170037 [bioreactor metagenome]|uniref:Uncharacterized protein n=1 Tax=bioreactor metagenome TaxID=1076179 RepID=A0A645GFA3_9ZZZZ
MIQMPSGLFQSEAILAKNLLGATPAEAVKPVILKISSRIRIATSVALGIFCRFSVTSR